MRHCRRAARCQTSAYTSRHTTVSRFTIHGNMTRRWSLEIHRDDKIVILSVMFDFLVDLTDFVPAAQPTTVVLCISKRDFCLWSSCDRKSIRCEPHYSTGRSVCIQPLGVLSTIPVDPIWWFNVWSTRSRDDVVWFCASSAYHDAAAIRLSTVVLWLQRPSASGNTSPKFRSSTIGYGLPRVSQPTHLSQCDTRTTCPPIPASSKLFPVSPATIAHGTWPPCSPGVCFYSAFWYRPTAHPRAIRPATAGRSSTTWPTSATTVDVSECNAVQP